MWKRTLAAAARIVFFTLFLHSVTTHAAEIKVWSGGAFGPVMTEIGPRFERAAGHNVVTEFAASPVFVQRLGAGQTFDVAILLPETIDAWIQQGKVVADTRANIARATLGLASRAGAVKPDVKTVDGLKRALLSASAVAYFPGGTVGKHFTSVLDRLGIATDMQSKLKPAAEGGASPALVAKGEAELAIAFVPAILGTPGVELVGVFPPELAYHVDLSAGVSTSAKEPDAARAFVKLLGSAEGIAVIKAKGFEPLAP